MSGGSIGFMLIEVCYLLPPPCSSNNRMITKGPLEIYQFLFLDSYPWLLAVDHPFL